MDTKVLRSLESMCRVAGEIIVADRGQEKSAVELLQSVLATLAAGCPELTAEAPNPCATCDLDGDVGDCWECPKASWNTQKVAV